MAAPVPLPQPAPSLPGHHAPQAPPPGKPWPAPGSKAGAAIATACLFEDSEIRLWENRLASGFNGPPHSHENDYWILNARCSTENKSHRIVLKSERDDWKPRTMGQGPDGTVTYVKKTTWEGGLGTETADNAETNPTAVAYLLELKEDGKPVAPLGASYGAAAGVLFENTEVKIWDLRVPPNQTGRVPADPMSSILHADVHGKRVGCDAVAELKASQNGALYLPMDMGKKKSTVGSSGGFARNTGNLYYKTPQTADAPGGAGEAKNESGSEEYRGILIEVKPVATANTARL